MLGKFEKCSEVKFMFEVVRCVVQELKEEEGSIAVE